MRIIASSSYLPKRKVDNKEISKKFNVDEEYIEKRNNKYQ